MQNWRTTRVSPTMISRKSKLQQLELQQLVHDLHADQLFEMAYRRKEDADSHKVAGVATHFFENMFGSFNDGGRKQSGPTATVPLAR